jgi:hypothetical protein
MYQVVDVAQVTAAATAELDALTVGMVCVRILQKSGGRYIGRWSYGHHLWTEYPAIGEELNNRTINIQQKLGLLKPNAADGDSSTKTGKTADSGGSDKKGASTAKQSMTAASNSQTPMTTESRSLLNSSWKIGVGFPEFEDEEADSLDIRRSVTKAVAKVRLDCLDCLYNHHFARRFTICIVRLLQSQPEPTEFFWMQIEDFVDMFNRVYIVTGMSVKFHVETMVRYVSSIDYFADLSVQTEGEAKGVTRR